MVFLDPFYLALVAFGVFVFATLITSACVRKIRNRRRFTNRRQPSTNEMGPDTEANNQNYEGPVNLYEAKTYFEYDPDLLVIQKFIQSG